MTTIEKMAKATYVKWVEDVQDLEPPWDDLPKSHRDRLIDATRAALQAIREIDPDIMLRVQWGRVPDRIQAYWSDTISAILEEKPE